jgi:sulfatase maturation enzyme AslB (radical SAM superfamily)
MCGKVLKPKKTLTNAVSCQNCPTKKTCKEICPAVEAILPRPQGGCKNKIKHYTPEVLEDMANRRALKYKGLMGRKIPPIEEYD